MMRPPLAPPQRRGLRLDDEAVRALLAAGGLSFAALVIAYALGRYGLDVFPVLLAAGPLAWAVCWPRSFAVVLLATLVVIEPNALDFTGPLSVSLYHMPPALAGAMPLTISPLELLSLVVLGAVVVRRTAGRRERWRRVPWLALGVPVVVALGLVYGLAKGADHRLAYHEMRGLVFATVAFALAVEFRDLSSRAAVRAGLLITTGLALLLLVRYFGYTRSGEVDRALEFAYAHESVIFLAAGLALSGALLLRAGTPGEKMLLALHSVLMLAATVATGRRSGTLVLLVAGAVVLLLLWRRKPVGTSILGLVLLVVFGAYLAAYWNQAHGGIAQPARAVRSYFDPNLRDQSSDDYRAMERASIVATIDSSPALGVGFGRPFFSFGGLPVLEFWPLQFFTPHQNILWLWLKMGLLGISVILGVWLIGMGRAVRAFVTAPRDRPLPVLPLVLASVLASYLFFATVDVTFSTTRAAVPLGIALGMAFARLPAWTPPRGRDARRAAEEAL